MHYAADSAELRVRFADWLAQSRRWTCSMTLGITWWQPSPQLLAQARRGEDAGFAGLEQKYALLVEKLGLTERSHQAKVPRIGPDLRSAALARVVALAVEKGKAGRSLPGFQAQARGRDTPGICRGRRVSTDATSTGSFWGKIRLSAWIEEQARSEGSAGACLRARAAQAKKTSAPFGDLAMEAGSRQAYIAWLERQRATRTPGEATSSCLNCAPPGRGRCSTEPRQAPQIKRIRGDGALGCLGGRGEQPAGPLRTAGSKRMRWPLVLAGVVPPLDKAARHHTP